MHEEKVADKNTPYWWEAAPVRPLPSQPLTKRLDITRRFGEAKAMAIEAEAGERASSSMTSSRRRGWIGLSNSYRSSDQKPEYLAKSWMISAHSFERTMR